MTGSLIAFLAISLFVLVTPGPDTAITIRSVLVGGRLCGVATALGVATGQLIWVLAASAGLVAVLIAYEPVFHAIKLAGACYLVWLGLATLWDAVRFRRPIGTTAVAAKSPLHIAASFRHGLISNLGNPKMAVFFASVLPQFAEPGAGMLSGLALLGLLFTAMTLAWLAIVSCLTSSAGDHFRRSKIGRALHVTMGGVLVMLGLRMATEQR
jgi:threonine/homoserine/homoserine lactone efflux protein